MSDEQKSETPSSSDQNPQVDGPAAPTLSAEKLDEIEEMDFLLEEIENKIAPLALA